MAYITGGARINRLRDDVSEPQSLKRVDAETEAKGSRALMLDERNRASTKMGYCPSPVTRNSNEKDEISGRRKNVTLVRPIARTPPTRALVLSVDEKSQIQALDREQPVLPSIPERGTHAYVRLGTKLLFSALDIASGIVIGKCYKRHRATEFPDFFKQIDARVPEGSDIHSIMEN